MTGIERILLSLSKRLKLLDFSIFDFWVHTPKAGGDVQREVSFLVYSEQGKDPHDFVVSMGEKYDQDAVIVSPKAGEASFVYTNDSAGENNPKGKVEPLGGLKIDSDSEWASTIEDEPESKFVYEKGGRDHLISESVSIYASAIKSMRL